MESLGIVIPAAGKGERLGHRIPKPFIEINGESILTHTVSRLLTLDPVSELVIACDEAYQEKVRQSLTKATRNHNVRLRVTKGGDSRQESVSRALSKVKQTDLTAVHDAVRPFFNLANVRECYQKASEMGAAILAVAVRDTIKIVDSDMSIRETPNRDKLWAAQTPQIFRTSLLKEALQKAEREKFTGTDDSSLLEHMGKMVQVVEGSQQNFKITFPEDLKRARQLLESGD